MVFSSLDMELGPLVPRRGNLVSRRIARAFMRMTRWRLEGPPLHLSKAVVIVAPHTSNWDFLVGVMGMFSTGIRFSWLGKNTMFRKPFGAVMRWLEGIPVDRTTPRGMVTQIQEVFEQRQKLLLALSPEGTRSAVSAWRSGFWRIARAAEVPIVPVFFDYTRRVIGFAAPFHPSEDYEHDLVFLQELYENITPKRPDKLSPVSN